LATYEDSKIELDANNSIKIIADTVAGVTYEFVRRCYSRSALNEPESTDYV
jgi:hypothetical protein